MKFTTQNYAKKAFLVPKLKPLVLNDLPFHKFEGVDSKYASVLNMPRIEKVLNMLEHALE